MAIFTVNKSSLPLVFLFFVNFLLLETSLSPFFEEISKTS